MPLSKLWNQMVLHYTVKHYIFSQIVQKMIECNFYVLDVERMNTIAITLPKKSFPKKSLPKNSHPKNPYLKNLTQKLL